MTTEAEKRRGPAGGGEPRSWENYPEPPPPRSSGCGVLFLVALIGAVIGCFIGGYTAPPQTDSFGPDFGADAVRLFLGAIAGFVIGLLVGAAIVAIRDAVARRSH
jgi:hypothetical protein